MLNACILHRIATREQPPHCQDIERINLARVWWESKTGPTHFKSCALSAYCANNSLYLGTRRGEYSFSSRCAFCERRKPSETNDILEDREIYSRANWFKPISLGKSLPPACFSCRALGSAPIHSIIRRFWLLLLLQ